MKKKQKVIINGKKKGFKQKVKDFWSKNKGNVKFVCGLAITGASAYGAHWAYKQIKEDIESTDEWKPHTLTLEDIDDEELIELYIDDPAFRQEYNVSGLSLSSHELSPILAFYRLGKRISGWPQTV